MFEFGGLGACLGIGLWVVGPFITKYLLGIAYSATNGLWSGFGVFIFLRYIGAGVGVQLAAVNKPLVRVGGQLVGLVVFFCLFMSFASRFGITYVPWIMSLSALATTMCYYVFMAIKLPIAKEGK